MPKIYLIAGEISGDMYGGEIISEMRSIIQDLEVYGIGGDSMKSVGLVPLFDISKLNFMGFFEVIKSIFTIKRLIDLTVKDIVKIDPDLVLLIDFSGFNQKVAERVKKINPKIKTIKFVSPQIWASRFGRIKKITKVYNALIPILPFEKKIYNDYLPSFECQYFGNPLKDQFSLNYSKDQFYDHFKLDSDKKIISIFPGSRKQEINYHLDTLYELISGFGEDRYLFPIVKTPNIDIELFDRFKQFSNVHIVESKYQWDFLHYSDLILSKSGTTVLQTVIAETPAILFYKTSNLNFWIAKRIMNIDCVGLPNIILGKIFIRELLQDHFTVENLKSEIDRLFNDRGYLEEYGKDINKLNSMLGDEGVLKRVAGYLKDQID